MAANARSRNFALIVTGLIRQPSLCRATLDVARASFRGEYMMGVIIVSELIAQHEFDWTLDAATTVAILSKRSSLQ
jgi:hypothetical protein